MKDHELFHETFQLRSSEAFVRLQNMIDEVIHLNTVYPVPLMQPASVLEQHFSSFRSLADPVYILVQSMLDDVEARSEVFVRLQNMIDEVIHLNTVYPVPLMQSASVLELDFSSFRSLADPVYIHVQSMLDDVKARIERENRQMVLYSIDRMISTIKRNSRR